MTSNIIKSRKVGGSIIFTVPVSIVEKANIQIGNYYGLNLGENGKIIFSPAQITF